MFVIIDFFSIAKLSNYGVFIKKYSKKSLLGYRCNYLITNKIQRWKIC